MLKRLEMMSKKQKIICILLLSILLIQLLSINAKSGIFPWLAGSGIITDNITDEIFEAINQSISSALNSILNWIMKVITSPFAPTIETLATHTKIGEDKNAVIILNNFSITAGMFVTTAIYGLAMIMYFFNKKITDMKDTPVSLTAKYAVAVAICYKHDVIINTFIKFINTLHTAYVANAIKQEGTINFLSIIAGNVEGEGSEKSMDLLGITVSFVSFPGVSFILIILQLVFLWKMLKAFIKMYLEMVSRYIVSFVLLCLFSVFGGTIVSNDTNTIFKSYLRTLFSSFLVLLFNILWFKLCFMIAVSQGASVMNILHYIFLLELLHLGVKIDGMLRSMGVGVATGASHIASSMGSAGRNLSNAFRNINDMRKGSGELLKAAGIASNNKDMYDIGAKIGATPSDLITGRKPGDPYNFAAEMGRRNKTVDDSGITGTQAAGIMNDVFNSPGQRNAVDALRGLSSDKLREGAQTLLGEGSGLTVTDAKIKSYKGEDGQNHIGAEITGQTADGTEFTGTIGNANSFDSGQMLDDGSVLHMENSLKNGETCSIEDAPYKAGSQAAKALSDAAETGYVFPEGTYLEKDGIDSNRDNAFNVMDGNGNQIGTVTGNQFNMSGEQLSAKEKSDAFRGMQSEIMGGVQKDGAWGNYDDNGSFHEGQGIRYDSISDFEPIEGQDGKYKATATTDNGKKVDFVATDKGIYAHSSTNDHAQSYTYSDKAASGSFAYDVNAGKLYSPEEHGNKASDQKFGTYKKKVNNNSGYDTGENNTYGGGSSVGEPRNNERYNSKKKNNDSTTASGSSFADKKRRNQ